MLTPRSWFRHAIPLILLADAALVYALILLAPGISTEYANAILCAGIIVVVALSAWIKVNGVTMALARGVAATLLFAIMAMWIFIHYMGITFLVLPLAAAQVAVLAMSLSLEPMGVWKGVVTSLMGMAACLITLGVLYPVFTVGFAFAEFAVIAPRIHADSVLTTSVSRIQGCAHQYAAQNPARGYPASLALLGPDGTKCLDKRYVKGKVGTVDVSYMASAPDANGVISDFLVRSDAVLYASEKPRVAYGDTSGFVRRGDPEAHRDSMFIAAGSLRMLNNTRACAEVYRSRNPEKGYPRLLSFIDSIARTDDQDTRQRLGCGDVITRAEAGRLPVVYRPIGTTNPITDYVVEVRPVIYGEGGIRTYYATSQGPVHVTKEDRPATANDPIMPECEYDRGLGLCASEPGGIPPLASIGGDSVVAEGAPYRITVEDPRPVGAEHAPYQAALECNYRTYATNIGAKIPYAFTYELVCPPLEPGTRQYRDRIVVRAWVRNRAGTVAMLLDTLRVLDAAKP